PRDRRRPAARRRGDARLGRRTAERGDRRPARRRAAGDERRPDREGRRAGAGSRAAARNRAAARRRPMMQTSHLVTTDHDGIRVLARARPPVNAIDLGVVEAFHTEVARLAEATDCRAVVLTGQGRTFCAGVDVKAVPAYDAATLRRMVRVINETILVLYGMPK